MPGLFDDLIPAKPQQSAVAFDDLIPATDPKVTEMLHSQMVSSDVGRQIQSTSEAQRGLADLASAAGVTTENPLAPLRYAPPMLLLTLLDEARRSIVPPLNPEEQRQFAKTNPILEGISGVAEPMASIAPMLASGAGAMAEAPTLGTKLLTTLGTSGLPPDLLKAAPAVFGAQAAANVPQGLQGLAHTIADPNATKGQALQQGTQTLGDILMAILGGHALGAEFQSPDIARPEAAKVVPQQVRETPPAQSLLNVRQPGAVLGPSGRPTTVPRLETALSTKTVDISGGERKGPVEPSGGEVSFRARASASAESIPNAQQRAQNVPPPSPEQARDQHPVIRQAVRILQTRDTTELMAMQRQIEGAASEGGKPQWPVQMPNLGIKSNTPADLSRLITARLGELKTGQQNPELNAIRATITPVPKGKVLDKTGQPIEAEVEWQPPGPKRGPLGTSNGGNTADQFKPALRFSDTGKIIEGQRGQAHADIKIAEARKGNFDAVTKSPEHGFVDASGKWHSRAEVSRALGESEPMQSERLRELQSSQAIGSSDFAPSSKASTMERLAAAMKERDQLSARLVLRFKNELAKGSGARLQDMPEYGRIQSLEREEALLRDKMAKEPKGTSDLPKGPHPANPKTAWLYQPVKGQMPTAGDLLRRVAADPTKHGDGNAALAKFYLDHFDHLLDATSVEVNAAHPDIGRGAWESMPGGGKIWLDAKNNDNHVGSLLHEANHAAIVEALENPRTKLQRDARDEILRIMNEARSALPAVARDLFVEHYFKRGINSKPIETGSFEQAYNKAGLHPDDWHEVLYGLSDPRELVATINNSPVLRDFLNSIKTGESKSLLSRLYDAFVKAVGIKPGSLLEKTFRAIQTIGEEEKNPTMDMESKMLGSSYLPIKRAGEELRAATTRTSDSEDSPFKDKFRGVDHIVGQFQRGDTEAMTFARRESNYFRKGLTPEQQKALTFLVESRTQPFQTMLAKIGTKNPEAVAAIKYAMSHEKELAPFERSYRTIMELERWAENQLGVESDFIRDYVKHYYDDGHKSVWDAGVTGMHFHDSFVKETLDFSKKVAQLAVQKFKSSGNKGGGQSNSFTKGRSFATLADAIEAGKNPSNLSIADLMESRLGAGRKLMNRVLWSKQLENMIDPLSGKPIAQQLARRPSQPLKRGQFSKMINYTPRDYNRVSVIPGYDFAVHDNYKWLYNSLTKPSALRENPISRAIINTEGFIKHGNFLIDTYHAIKLLLKQQVLVGTRNVGYNKGLSLLEYNPRTIDAMVKSGEIAPAMRDWYIMNKEDADLLIKHGLEVGRISDQLADWVKPVKGLGTINSWIFQKLQRGIMMQTALYELDRARTKYPGSSPDELARGVSKQVNILFGNLGKQSFIKDATLQDIARIVLIAPQWTEAMARTEGQGYAQLLRNVGEDISPGWRRDAAKVFRTDVLSRSIGKGFVYFFLANQVLSLALNKRFTWQNKDNKHKMDAFIPVGDEGKGFHLSPFSVIAEITHAMLNKPPQQDWPQAALRYGGNKLSYLSRSSIDVAGFNYKGQYMPDTGTRLKQAAKDLAPLPIQSSPLLKGTYDYATGRVTEQDTKEGIRNMMASLLGAKVTPTTYAEEREARFEKQHGDQTEEQASWRDRYDFEQSERQSKETMEPLDKLSMEQQASVNKYKATEAVTGLLPKESQQWLKEQKLAIPDVSTTLTVHPQWKVGKYEGPEIATVSLKDDERVPYYQRLAEKITTTLKQYRPFIEGAADKADKTKHFNKAIDVARELANREWLQEHDTGASK